MERHDVLAMMTALKLAGMRAAYDDILADGLKRRHPVQQIIGTLLQTEVADKQARSIKYQMTSAVDRRRMLTPHSHAMSTH